MRKHKLPQPKAISSRSALSQEQADAYLVQHASKISEMFDGVVILATRLNRDGSTQICQVHLGNAFMARGLIEHANASFEPIPSEEPDCEDDDD